MKKVILTILACISVSFVLHAQELDNRAGTVLYRGDFDAFSAGFNIAQSHPAWWTTWNTKPGSEEDAVVTAEQAASAPHSLKIKYGTDLVFKAGNKTTGIFTIEFDMFVPYGGQAYFSLIQDFSSSASRFAITFTFNGKHYSLPYPNVILHNNKHTNFTFPFDEWFPVSLFIDLDNDIANVKINNIQYLEWKWSIDYVGKAGVKQLSAINMCPNWYPPDPAYFSFYDNLVFTSLTGTGVPALAVTPASIHETITEGTPSTVTKYISIANSGEVKGSYHAWLEGVSNDWISLPGSTTGIVPVGGSAGFSAVIKSEGLANGTHTATLKISTNDPDYPVFQIPCTLVLSKPASEISVNLDFINENLTEATTLTKHITITNSGNADGEYEAKLKNFSGSGDWISLSGATTGTLSAGSSKTFDAIINTNEIEYGTYTATIVITTNDLAHQRIEIPCKLIYSNVGIEIITNDDIVVYPNPTTGIIIITGIRHCGLDPQSPANVEIFDVMGRIVAVETRLATSLHETLLDISHIPSGIYFIRIHTEKGVVTRKIVKQ